MLEDVLGVASSEPPASPRAAGDPMREERAEALCVCFGFPANRVLLAAAALFPCLADGNDDSDSSNLLGRRHRYSHVDEENAF